MESATPESCGSCGPWWRLPLMLVFVLMGVYLARVYGLRDDAPKQANDESTATAEAANQVTLVIDFGDGRLQQHDNIRWHKGMTIQDIFRSQPNMKLIQRGAGQSAFLTAIDGVANEGADGRNWTYAVNGKLGDRSFAIYELQPGDRVLWSFTAQK
jgi:hypothetical protein